ncbi:hypothetical protein [Pararhizobium gei]|uniref:hypothetical protein n=1 Tax=Pararhizobium gei TaxID=1395951 RepID=UPI0023DCA4BC|nr:hypothetical protein [Rhizobium gei]
MKIFAITVLALGMATAPSFAQSTTVDTMQPKAENCTVPGADNVNCKPNAAGGAMSTDTMSTGAIATPMEADPNAKARSQADCEVPGADNANCRAGQ